MKCSRTIALNLLLNFFLLLIGSVAGNLILAGYFTYGIPLTVAGLVFAFVLLKMDKEEQNFNRSLVDRRIY